ncbi:FXL12-like protein, partial [Mya arenaria]
MELLDLPDSLVLEILSYLPIKDLCVLSRTCQRCNKIARDKSLWRDIDITDKRISLKKAWKFYRSRLSDCLQKIRMAGFYTQSDALLEDIRTNCPNLEDMMLQTFYLSNISSSKLPSSLQYFTVESCQWPMGWLKGSYLPNLKCLQIKSCSRVDDQELKDVVKLTTLKTLHLGNLYRIKNNGVKVITENLTQLEQFELESLNIDDLAVHHICRNMQNLDALLLSKCNITNAAVDNVFVSLPKLKHLDISSNKKLDQQILTMSLKSKSLVTL